MSEGSPRQITVVLLQDETASKLVAMLRDELQLTSSSIHTARGTGTGAPGLGQFGLEVEKDVLSVIVPAGQADEAFARIYEFTEMSTRYGGFHVPGRAPPHSPPDPPRGRGRGAQHRSADALQAP